MKIIVRIPTEAYAFTEVHFDSIEEYKTQYPQFASAMIETSKNAKLMASNASKTEKPF